MVLRILISFLLAFDVAFVHADTLNENCTVNIMNRTVQVQSDGSWALPNIPSFMGRVRARVTCING
jgi:hypothetical protein